MSYRYEVLMRYPHVNGVHWFTPHSGPHWFFTKWGAQRKARYMNGAVRRNFSGLGIEYGVFKRGER